MLRRLASVGGFTLISRFTGFGRDAIMAAVLGAGPLSDAFLVAFRIPNHFRAIFAEGAFNAAFLPLYARRLEQEGMEAARRFGEDVLAFQVALQIALWGAALAAMPFVVMVLAPGFAEAPAQMALATELTRITFSYLACIALVAQFGAMLNAAGHFKAAAAAPILMNGAMALCLVGARWFPTPAHAAAVGVALGGIGELLLLTFSVARGGQSLRLRRPRWTRDVAEFVRALGPATLGSMGVQLGLFADTIIASFLAAGELTALYYADRVNQLPMGVIGVALGTVLLPEVSRRLAAEDGSGAQGAVRRAIEIGLLLTLPCAAAFVAVPDVIMHALFARGAFDREAAEASGLVLSAYAIGLPAFVLIRCATPMFYGRSDTATPVQAVLFGVAVNVGVKLAVVGTLGAAGLALGTSAGAWANLALLLWLASRRKYARVSALATSVGARIVAAAALLGAFVAAIDGPVAADVAQLPSLRDEAQLIVLTFAGLVAYPIILLLLGVRPRMFRGN